MSPDFLNALKIGSSIGVMVDILDLPDGDVRVWSGIGAIVYGGYTYKGLGRLGSIQSSPRTVEIRVDNVVLTLSGIDQGSLNHISYEIRDKVATTYLIVMDDWSKIIGRMVIDNILLDYMIDVVDDSGSYRLEVHGEAGFYNLTTPSRRAMSPTDQKLTYPDDTGCDYVPLMQNKDTKWTKTAV